MTRTIDLASCSAGDLRDAFDAAADAIVPDLATCSPQALALAFSRARAATRSARVAADRAVARTRTITFISLIGR